VVKSANDLRRGRRRDVDDLERAVCTTRQISVTVSDGQFAASPRYHVCCFKWRTGIAHVNDLQRATVGKIGVMAVRRHIANSATRIEAHFCGSLRDADVDDS